MSSGPTGAAGGTGTNETRRAKEEPIPALESRTDSLYILCSFSKSVSKCINARITLRQFNNVLNDFKRTVEVNQNHNIVDSFISLHILLILFYYLFPFHSHLYLYIYIFSCVMCHCFIAFYFFLYFCIFFVFFFFCTFHWADLSWLTFHQGRNHGIDIGGVQMWALPQISDRKNKQARPSTTESRLINGVGSAGTPWSVTPAVHYSAYFQGIMLAIILSHLNVIFVNIYSKIATVFLTMALLFRCLLAYRLKKRRMSACSSCFFLLAPSDSRTERFFQTMPQAGVYGLNQVYNRGGVVTQFCFPCFS